MSEGNHDAAFLIAVSYQALIRAIENNPGTPAADCTVLILFAGYYVEATLNHIFSSLEKDIKAFAYNKISKASGMNDKLMLFYNEFIEDNKATNWKELRDRKLDTKLNEMFPSYSELRAFRNDISHGKINGMANSLDKALELRQQAKDLTGRFYAITAEKGYNVQRLTTYREAIAYLDNHKSWREQYAHDFLKMV